MPIRPKYNPRPNARERAHILKVCEEPCFGCGAHGGVAHHVLVDFPGKRWRRDHQAVLPTCPACHALIHDTFGNERDWLARWDKTVPMMIAEVRRLWNG